LQGCIFTLVDETSMVGPCLVKLNLKSKLKLKDTITSMEPISGQMEVSDCIRRGMFFSKVEPHYKK